MPNAPTISPPSNNTELLSDAQAYGMTYTGVTTITLNGTSATVVNCPSSCTTTTVNLTQYPVIYVSNGANCTPYAYSPFNVTYSTSGCTGDVYVSGNYTTPLTIGAANNIIVDGNITTSSSGPSTLTGNAVLGLIANAFIRVMHGVTYPDGTCDGNSNNVSSQTFSNMTIDAAMLAIQHSFIVDNFSCGASLGSLTVNGAIAQYFRGAVGPDHTEADPIPGRLFDVRGSREPGQRDRAAVRADGELGDAQRGGVGDRERQPNRHDARDLTPRRAAPIWLSIGDVLGFGFSWLSANVATPETGATARGWRSTRRLRPRE